MMPLFARRLGPLLFALASALVTVGSAAAQDFEAEGDAAGAPETEAAVPAPPGELEPAGLDGAAPLTTPTRPTPEPGRTGADYALRLRELEDRVNELKEEIFRSKSRLVLLRERVLQSHIGGSQAVITHVNDMSATFDLVQVVYSLDGTQIYSALDDGGSLADQDRIQIYNGAIVPGPHNVSVEMIFVGNGFGLFSYLEGYRFRLRSSYAFTAEDAKIARLDVIAYERGGVNQPIEERPDIRYELEFVDPFDHDAVALEN
jgi:hypothetical protein